MRIWAAYRCLAPFTAGHLDQLPNCVALLAPVSCSMLSHKPSDHPEIVDIKISKEMATNPVG